MSPPPAMTVSGRPLLNLSLAINHAIGGTAVRGYHGLNLGIHLLAGLTLFGILRRSLRWCPGWDGCGPFGAVALPLAVALLWVLHPLQTEAVTYLSQRTEILMGLC